MRWKSTMRQGDMAPCNKVPSQPAMGGRCVYLPPPVDIRPCWPRPRVGVTMRRGYGPGKPSASSASPNFAGINRATAETFKPRHNERPAGAAQRGAARECVDYRGRPGQARPGRVA